MWKKVKQNVQPNGSAFIGSIARSLNSPFRAPICPGRGKRTRVSRLKNCSFRDTGLGLFAWSGNGGLGFGLGCMNERNVGRPRW